MPKKQAQYLPLLTPYRYNGALTSAWSSLSSAMGNGASWVADTLLGVLCNVESGKSAGRCFLVANDGWLGRRRTVSALLGTRLRPALLNVIELRRVREDPKTPTP